MRGTWSFILSSVFLLSVPAIAVDYNVGTAKAVHYNAPGATTKCTTIGSVICNTYDSSQKGAVYYLTFAEGYTRTISHVGFRRDPLKSLGETPTPIKYRIEHRGLMDVIQVLDSDGKEGTYIFATKDDDPKRQQPRSYGPAPVSSPVLVTPSSQQ
jgi:hypothetical protein